jgi:hypothetical protein
MSDGDLIWAAFLEGFKLKQQAHIARRVPLSALYKTRRSNSSQNSNNGQQGRNASLEWRKFDQPARAMGLVNNRWPRLHLAHQQLGRAAYMLKRA